MPEVLAITVSFRCGTCKAIISADARWEDQDIQCPRCAAMTQVPHWSGPRAAALQGAHHALDGEREGPLDAE